MEKTLTIGMATYDDFDGVYFSIQALRMYHDIVNTDAVEIIVVDNNPNGKHAQPVKDLVTNWVPNGKYIPFSDKTSTASRNEIFANSTAKYCISMDCHVLFFKDAIKNLIEYYEANPNCKNIVHGPLIYDNLFSPSTHFKPTWGGDMYGQWATNEAALRKNEPFEIPMQGLGVFSCVTKNWRGFNSLFRGFGGEEGYIHEKFRRAGGKAICLPSFKWLHRFGRPEGVKYPLILEDRIWNYFVGWLEITQDPEHQMIKDIYNNFKQRIPEYSLNDIYHKAVQSTIKEGELHVQSK